MPVQRWIKLPSLAGLAANQTAVCQIPVGPRYHILQLSGTSASASTATTHLAEMRLKLNGKVQRVFTYAELQSMNILYGTAYGIQGNSTNAHFELPIFLCEPWRKSNVTQDLLAWATGNVSSFQLEIDIKTAPTSLAITAAVDNSIIVDGGQNVQQPIGAIVKWNRVTVPCPGTTVDINFGAINNRDAFQQIRIPDASSYITSYKVIVDNFVIREMTKNENDAMLVAYGMTPISTALDIVFDANDIINSYLPMIGSTGQRVQDFRIQLTSSTALSSAAILYQTLGSPD